MAYLNMHVQCSLLWNNKIEEFFLFFERFVKSYTDRPEDFNVENINFLLVKLSLSNRLVC